MAFDYYCTHCGKKLNQDTVLFDMQYLLTGDKNKKFQLLKFRMTQKEFKEMLAKGTLLGNGRYACALRFEDVLRIIGNRNNMNQGKTYTEKGEDGKMRVVAMDADIVKLTLRDIDAYISAAAVPFVQKKKPSSGFGLFDDEPEDAPEEEVKKEEYKPSAAVTALEFKDVTNTDRNYTKVILRADFELLRTYFAQNDRLVFNIKEIFDPTDKKENILCGYEFRVQEGAILTLSEARVCNNLECGAPVFKHAGTAKHQAVTFIGYQAAGKTSTILALAHYAEHCMMGKLEDSGIWDSCEPIDSVQTCELLETCVEKDGEVTSRLLRDLANYGKGIAPEKTEDNERINAYSATFRIKSRASAEHLLLTLIDLPGELFLSNGEIKIDDIRNKFQVALSCDAYIMCFDVAYRDKQGRGVAAWAMNVCKWADEIQKMRAGEGAKELSTSSYIPIMLLFTKCRDLEVPEAPIAEQTRAFTPDEMVYSLRDEKQRILKNSNYRFVRDQFREYGQLSNAYHAMMRCSPFGYAAPTQGDLNDLTKDRITQEPSPKNIDRLMRWILSVAGCIPTEAEYRRGMTAVPYRLDNYRLNRPQLRSENPKSGEELQEALARCALFENPGRFDRSFVGKYDVPWQFAVVRTDSNWHPNTNAK